MFEILHMFPEGALFFKKSPGISSLVCSVWFFFFSQILQWSGTHRTHGVVRGQYLEVSQPQ